MKSKNLELPWGPVLESGTKLTVRASAITTTRNWAWYCRSLGVGFLKRKIQGLHLLALYKHILLPLCMVVVWASSTGFDSKIHIAWMESTAVVLDGGATARSEPGSDRSCSHMVLSFCKNTKKVISLGVHTALRSKHANI